MQALIVHAHPEKESFVAAMRDVVKVHLESGSVAVCESDLYAIRFNPVLSSADFGTRRDTASLTYALEQRHNYEASTLAPDVLAEIEKVMAADLLVFTFPLFWFSVPAILKGWIDRVFISGPFYGGQRIYRSGGLRGKKALVACSLGGREHMFGRNSLHGELETGMLRHFLQGTLGYVGLEVIRPFIAYRVPYVQPQEREEMLAALGQYIDHWQDQPTMMLPDLADFDGSFRRKIGKEQSGDEL